MQTPVKTEKGMCPGGIKESKSQKSHMQAPASDRVSELGPEH